MLSITDYEARTARAAKLLSRNGVPSAIINLLPPSPAGPRKMGFASYGIRVRFHIRLLRQRASELEMPRIK